MEPTARADLIPANAGITGRAARRLLRAGCTLATAPLAGLLHLPAPLATAAVLAAAAVDLLAADRPR